MARIKYKGKLNMARIVTKVVLTTITLYVSGVLMNTLGDVLRNHTSQLAPGFKLIGWTVEANSQTNGTPGCYVGCGNGLTGATVSACNATDPNTQHVNCITDTSGAGVIAVIGIIGIAAIALEFVEFKL